jgi:two-component system NtrC family sensor kinase
MSESPVQLIPKNPQPGFPEKYDLIDSQTTVGRHPTNKIVLPFESISRFHARIDRRGDYYIVQDLNSSNGSYVNNERITQMTIHHGDAVTFGNVEFVFANESSQSSIATHASSVRGKDIVDITDDEEDVSKSSSRQQSVKKVEEVSKDKSSVISSADRKSDKASLVKVNARLRGLYELSEILRQGSSDPEEDILRRVLDVAFASITADRGVILTRYSAEAEQFDVAAVKYADAPIVSQKVSVSRTILEQVLTQKVAILSKDAQADDRFDASESIIMSQVRSTICCPMVMGGRVMGILHLDTSSSNKAFNDDDLAFAMIITNETGIALDNMRMRTAAMHRERLAAVGETVAGISHNVKNILLLSQGGAELLTRAFEREDIEGAQEAWGVVRRGIDRIGALVRDMLEYSSNKVPSVKDVDVNEMLCGIAEEVEKDLVKKNVMLELDLDESISEWPADEIGLHRTTLNLIVNAMEAITHQEGRILLSTSVRDSRDLVIMIRDNGCGIPPEKLEKIFFPFFTTKGSSGTGLGLPMCKKSIEDMGGTITVESEANVGTVFTLLIPNDAGARSGRNTSTSDDE